MAWAIVFIILWCGWAWVTRWILQGQVRTDPALREDALIAMARRGAGIYARRFQRARAAGLANIPAESGPLIVVVNHTAGIDPILVQAFCAFEIRWMMANDMRLPSMRAVWELLRVIGVERGARDTRSLREAVAHVKGGGAVGIFPEGRIERPAGALLAFHQGVGMIASMTGAPVLPVFIRGTPESPTAWGSIVRRGRARLVFGALIHVPRKADPEEATATIRAWFAREAARGA
jgi:1-acyl-sn-glycerol-3-phosphate acyltransferase